MIRLYFIRERSCYECTHQLLADLASGLRLLPAGSDRAHQAQKCCRTVLRSAFRLVNRDREQRSTYARELPGAAEAENLLNTGADSASTPPLPLASLLAEGGRRA